MSDIPIISTLRTAGTSGHAIAVQREIRGGWQVFADIADRDSFSPDRMVLGMPCTVLDAGGAVTKKYDLTSLSPATWTEQTGGGGGGAPSGPAGGDLTGTYPNPTLRRGGLFTHPADTFAISFADPVQQVRDATGAVTITGLTGPSAGASVELTLRNTTANDIPVTVVPGVQWASRVPSVLVAFGEATIDLTSIGVADADVVARWTAPLTLVERAIASGADCGNGCDGDLVVTGDTYVARDSQFRKVTISGAGRLIADASAATAASSVVRIQVLDLTAAGPNALTGKQHDQTAFPGTSAGVGGPQPNAGHYFAGSTGGAIRQPSGANGGVAAGAAGGVAPTGTSVGGYQRRPAGAGGAGSGGAGGAAGGAGTALFGVESLVPSVPALMWANNSSGGGAFNISNGGLPGASGGGGGGDGTSGGGGGAGGPGNKPLDFRVGVLLVSPSTGMPIINGRGGGGGAGGPAVAGNRGGGGGGSGAGGGRVYLDLGEIVLVSGAVLPLVGAIDATAGVGGVGGDGFGTGVGGGGGGGGGGGKVVVRRPSGFTIIDNTAGAGSLGIGAVGTVGGAGGAGLATVGNLS